MRIIYWSSDVCSADLNDCAFFRARDDHDFGLALQPVGGRIEAVGLRQRAGLVLIGEQYVDRATFYQGSEVVPVTVHAKAVREREGDLASSVPGGLDRNAHSGARDRKSTRLTSSH